MLQTPTTSKLLTADEAAVRLRKHPVTLIRWARDGKSPVTPVRMGSRWYFPSEAIDALLRGQTIPNAAADQCPRETLAGHE